MGGAGPTLAVPVGMRTVGAFQVNLPTHVKCTHAGNCGKKGGSGAVSWLIWKRYWDIVRSLVVGSTIDDVDGD